MSPSRMEHNVFSLALAASFVTQSIASEVFAHYMASLTAFKAITAKVRSLTTISLGQSLLNML